MTIIRSIRIAPVAFAAMLCTPAFAFAQAAQTPTMATPHSAAAPASAAPMGNPAGNKALEAKVEARINELHAQLKITPAEENDWKQFADVMRTNAREMDAVVQQRTEKYPSMNALQNMESYGQVAQTHAEHLQKLSSAFETLYNALPAPQKQVADQVFRAKTASQPQHASATTGNRPE